MKKFMQKRLKNEKGLTLVELLAVIVILGIIAAIAVPAIGKIIDNTKDKAILADASNILSAAKLAMAEGSCETTTTCSKTDLAGLVEGLDSNADFSATKDATTNEWTVKYNNFANIKNAKFKTDIGADNTTKESNLNKLMGNKKTEPTTE
ncbi:prepilin-type N-terminal cleavage/methylation domain-containing protein [Sporosarcina sp. 179-K 3D1 HS]|uniref:type II secretion system protein n=1 Tax=Sporosarcina sp. 179-K 3D1 HS TaxID=3232169 RepID=UPI0039A25B32